MAGERLFAKGLWVMGKDQRKVPDPTRDGKVHDNPHHAGIHSHLMREQQTPKPQQKGK